MVVSVTRNMFIPIEISRNHPWLWLIMGIWARFSDTFDLLDCLDYCLRLNVPIQINGSV